MKIYFSKGIILYQQDKPENPFGKEGVSTFYWTLECQLNTEFWEIYEGAPPVKKGHLFFIAFHRNPYEEWKLGSFERKGQLTPKMFSAILHILDNVSPEIYLNLLLEQLQPSRRLPPGFTFRELEVIYKSVKSLEMFSHDLYPPAGSLIHQTGFATRRFQKGCLLLFGNSLQNIIRQYRMTKVLHDILIQNLTPESVAYSLGFKHYGNFSRSFHAHFGVTPAVAASFGNNSSTLS